MSVELPAKDNFVLGWQSFDKIFLDGKENLMGERLGGSVGVAQESKDKVDNGGAMGGVSGQHCSKDIVVEVAVKLGGIVIGWHSHIKGLDREKWARGIGFSVGIARCLEQILVG